MEVLILIINYLAFGILIFGLTSVLKSKFKIRDITFLVGTILLTLGALLSWLLQSNFKIFSFVLLFGLQVVANIFQIKSKNEKLNTVILLLISASLFVVFAIAGLFQSSLFFLIALGTVITGIGYKERPEHVLRQSILFVIGTICELFFAFFTKQNFYVVLNSTSLFFIILILFRSLQGKIQTSKPA